MLLSAKTKALTFSAIIVVVIWQSLYCAALCQTRSKQLVSPQNHPVMYGYNGAKITALRPEQVKTLCFYGGSFYRFSNVPVVTRDPALIRKFLHAVQYPASSGFGKQMVLLNRSDTLEIWPKNARKDEKLIQVSFLARTKYPTRDCFGSEFVAALNLLGKAEAKRYAALAVKLQGKVSTIASNDAKIPSIRDRAKIKEFLTALQSLDERACAYGDWDAIPFRFDLKLKNGKEQEIDLLVPQTILHSTAEKQPPVWLWPFTKSPV